MGLGRYLKKVRRQVSRTWDQGMNQFVDKPVNYGKKTIKSSREKGNELISPSMPSLATEGMDAPSAGDREIIDAQNKKKSVLRKAVGRRQMNLTGGLGVLSSAPVIRKKLLGG